MSQVQVTIETVKSLHPIPDADNIEVAEIANYPVVVRKESVVEGGEVIYFPPDIQLPLYVAEQLGVDKYMRAKGTVVKAVRLKGQLSHGMAFPITDFPQLMKAYKLFENPTDVAGLDVSAYFGARKFVVPPKFNVGVGQETNENPSLYRYTDIDNIQKFGHIFQDGEQVYVTEKIHGANCRVAMIDGELMAGSRKTQRKPPENFDVETQEFVGDTYQDNMYWFPLTIPGVKQLLEELGKSYRQVILFGEVFGKGIQGSFDYDRKGIDFLAFDIMVNGDYMNPASFFGITSKYGVPTVPIDYIGEYNLEYIAPYIEARSHLTEKHIREGVVIQPLNNRRDSRHGRVIAKYINPEYLLKKSADKVVDNQE